MLFTMYAIIDKSDAHILWGYRAIQERLTTQSIEQFRGDFVATRREAAIFTSRKYGVPEVKIWNASNPNAPVTAHEFSIMRNRCDKKVMIVPDTLLLKRWEIIKTLINSK